MTQHQKYHRTYHFPWSHPHSDDKSFSGLSHLSGKEIVVLEKMDGENTTIYSDGHLHARSLSSAHNYTRDWIKRLAAIVHPDIPDGWRFVFENVHYYHSIQYTDLEGFAYLLSIWDQTNTRLAFDEMMEYAHILDLPTPKLLFRGTFSERILREIASNMDLTTSEGYVATITDPVPFSEAPLYTAKFVRDNHCQPNKHGVVEHWLKNTYPNKLKEEGKPRPHYMSMS